MYDNGLLKYYKNGSYNGFLDASNMPLSLIKKLGPRLNLCSLPEGMFYSKYAGDSILGKRIVDAEILVSQIYNRAGLRSAVYLPVNLNGINTILSNNIETQDTLIAGDCIKSFSRDSETFPMDFLSSSHTKEEVLKYFTDRALEQQIKMRVYDTASYIGDRHTGNYLYTLNDGKIDGVSCIDFEVSGLVLGESTREEEGYPNDFIEGDLTRQQLLEKYKTSSLVSYFIDKSQLAEEIGSINPQEVADDIKVSTGYEIDSGYTQFLARSYNEVAESLIQ